MATLYMYQCPKCGWGATVSKMARYHLMSGCYRQYICSKCHEVFSAPVPTKIKECPECGHQEKEPKTWQPFRGCPHCGTALEILDGVMEAD